MTKQTSTSAMFEELGDELNQAHKQHKNVEVDYGSGGNLPAGIEGGVARLVDCRFSQYKSGDLKDKWFFLAAGVVVHPESHDGLTISNMRTMIMEPVCDTPTRTRKTVADHWRWVRNELLKLGVDTKSVSPKTVEKVVAQLKKEKPHFQFRTWIGKKQELEIHDGKVFVDGKQYRNKDTAKQANPFLGNEPRVREEWRGKCEAPQPTEATDEVINGLTDVTEMEDQVPDNQEFDLMNQAEAADENGSAKMEDNPHAARVQEMLLAAGVSQDDINKADSWVDAAGLVDSTPPETETSGGGADESPDFISLGLRADHDEDEEAIEELVRLAKEAELDDDAYETWSMLAEDLAKASGVQNEGEDGDSDPFAVENVVGYRKRTPSGRLGKNTVEVEIVSRDGDTFSVRNLDTGDPIDDVDVKQLSPLE